MKKKLNIIASTLSLAAPLIELNREVDEINRQAQLLSESTGMSFEECKQIILDGKRVVVHKGAALGPSIPIVPHPMYSEKVATYETSMTPKEYGQSLQRNKKHRKRNNFR